MMSCMVKGNVHLSDLMVKYVYSFNTEKSLHIFLHSINVKINYTVK